eukprot:TRINITY_DN3171_c0_g1_i2.p1 TRINITY_DN3171_c0_g1~~TRINITY_DN3171_c0_g1_i2.p1  ORF type:complete len:384 (+),score=36.25 TRINITY_DN3171_c0_g1_i2:41-1192(+)
MDHGAQLPDTRLGNHGLQRRPSLFDNTDQRRFSGVQDPAMSAKIPAKVAVLDRHIPRLGVFVVLFSVLQLLCSGAVLAFGVLIGYMGKGTALFAPLPSAIWLGLGGLSLVGACAGFSAFSRRRGAIVMHMVFCGLTIPLNWGWNSLWLASAYTHSPSLQNIITMGSSTTQPELYSYLNAYAIIPVACGLGLAGFQIISVMLSSPLVMFFDSGIIWTRPNLTIPTGVFCFFQLGVVLAVGTFCIMGEVDAYIVSQFYGGYVIVPGALLFAMISSSLGIIGAWQQKRAHLTAHLFLGIVSWILTAGAGILWFLLPLSGFESVKRILLGLNGTERLSVAYTTWGFYVAVGLVLFAALQIPTLVTAPMLRIRLDVDKEGDLDESIAL